MRISSIYKLLALVALAGAAPALLAEKETPIHNWTNHAQVAREVINHFEELKSLQGNFQIQTTGGSGARQMSGRFYYQKPDKIRYEFSSPAGNLIVSNGSTMWYYIRRRNLVGKQDLRIQKKNSSGQAIFVSGVVSGLSRLFRMYHYHFDTPEQPRQIDGEKTFVLSMKQRTRIGGYEELTLFVDAEKYFVRKAIGNDGYGKQSTIQFSNLQANPQLEGKLFQFQADDNVRVVNNPFVADDRDQQTEASTEE
ncbi:MAG: outer membrane lipoprotein carrier protein LolA [Leptospiraceae bacterium]|nr:outer membrane lipoprotein carrier protein LolA [Leptospiraceae bacterium]